MAAFVVEEEVVAAAEGVVTYKSSYFDSYYSDPSIDEDDADVDVDEKCETAGNKP